MSDTSDEIADVFISYARSRDPSAPDEGGERLTRSLADDLEAAGFSTWWDTRRLLPGQNFRTVINEQLEGCKAVIIIWTKDSVKSDWVVAEADHAWRLGKLVNIHEASVKPHQIPKPFDQMHSVELSNRAAIFDAVRRRIATHRPPSPAPPPGDDDREETDRRTQERRPPVQRVRGDEIPAVRLLPDDKTDEKATGGSGGQDKRRRTRRAVMAAGVAAALIVCGLAVWLLADIFRPPALEAAPRWAFERRSFIGQPIPFKWTFETTGSAKSGGGARARGSVMFELSSALDDQFTSDGRSDSLAAGDHKDLSNINATRFWRVRAVVAGNSAADSRPMPLSAWSEAIEITQYESAYERIRATRAIRLYASNSDNQGIFKWVDGKGPRGFDLKLANAVRDELAARMKVTLDPIRPNYVVWKELLGTPAEDRSDMIIASVTKLPERRTEYQIEFSQTYFCTTYAFMHRFDEPNRPIRELIAGKIVGVQDRTSGARLVEALRQEIPFEMKAYPDTESISKDIAQRRIDYAVTDTPFAMAEELKYRGYGRSRPVHRDFKAADFPAAFPADQRVQHYGVVVHEREGELLGAINAVIARIKADGTLARYLDESAAEFVEGLGSSQSGERLQANRSPWECG